MSRGRFEEYVVCIFQSPVFNNPTTVVVHAVNGDVNELDVFDITITNTGICTYFVCDVVCLNDAKLFWIDEGMHTISLIVGHVLLHGRVCQ